MDIQNPPTEAPQQREKAERRGRAAVGEQHREDVAGERLAAEALARGCVLVLAFADLGDALRCKARLDEGAT